MPDCQLEPETWETKGTGYYHSPNWMAMSLARELCHSFEVPDISSDGLMMGAVVSRWGEYVFFRPQFRVLGVSQQHRCLPSYITSRLIIRNDVAMEVVSPLDV